MLETYLVLPEECIIFSCYLTDLERCTQLRIRKSECRSYTFCYSPSGFCVLLLSLPWIFSMGELISRKCKCFFYICCRCNSAMLFPAFITLIKYFCAEENVLEMIAVNKMTYILKAVRYQWQREESVLLPLWGTEGEEVCCCSPRLLLTLIFFCPVCESSF